MREQAAKEEVVTPGNNEKRYLAGAGDVASRQLIWVEGKRKARALFIARLATRVASYPRAKVIPVILDNSRIHSSKLTGAALAGGGGRIQLHFLPPYSPEENRIGRVWEDRHGNVTRNHTCPTMTALMREVRYCLRKRVRQLRQRCRRGA